MNTTLLYVVVAVLALGFLVGGVAAWQTNKESALPAVEFSSPFRPDEALGNLNLEYVSVKNSGGADCRTVEVAGRTYEVVPRR